MNLLQKLVSYIYPLKIKTIPSEHSGTLEVTLVNGKLVIDSENANYSYGSLQKVLRKGLLYIGKDKLRNLESILILGVAGGSVIQTLRNDFNLKAKITGVEIDKEVLLLANTYFQLNKTANLELVKADAFHYINTTKKNYDLIIVDIFNDTEMPQELFKEHFWKSTHNLLNKNGLCLFNTIYTSSKDIERNKSLTNDLEHLFTSINRIKTQQINELFILEK